MIYLMRHGADDPDRLGGWSACGLTDTGKRQVYQARKRLANLGITEIYTSDLPRAKQTAEIVADELRLPVTLLPAFREVNNGVLAGMPKAQAARDFPGVFWKTLDWTQTYPGGESPQQFCERIKAAWLALKYSAQDQTVLLVTHGGVINLILCIENNVPYTNRELHFPVQAAEIISISEQNTANPIASKGRDSFDHP